jgi:toxin CcdB
MVARRFDVFRNPSGVSAKKIPYFLVVQSDLLGEMDTCVVLPLAKAHAAQASASARLNPQFEIEGSQVVMLTQLIGVIPMRALHKHVVNLDIQRGTIVCALNFLCEGI